MKNLLVLILMLSVGISYSHAQKYKLKNSTVDFYSYAPLEDIKAKNSTTTGIIDSETNKFTFKAVIMDFVFPNKLMQEHFNENYMESHKYPNSTFKGAIDGKYDLKKEGVYNVITKGDLTIHGVTRAVEIPATINVSKKEIKISSEFKVKLADYKIDIPTLVFQKIAEVIDVKIEATLVEI